MKKLIAFLLCLAMTAFVLPGCTGGETASTSDSGTQPPTTDTRPPVDSDFLAGFGVGDITPPTGMSIPLQGYGNHADRMSTGASSYLYVHCLAVRDVKGSTALLLSVDNAALTEEFISLAQSRISSTTQVPKTNIVLSAVHQHSGGDYALHQQYYSLMLKAVAEAAKEAIADLSPADIWINSVEAENLTFVRNYICEDGSIKGPNYPSNSPIKDHESVADVTLQLLKFVRGGDKQDILVSNFQSHPLMGSSSVSTDAHADFVGYYRDYVEGNLDCHAMYFSGAQGNLTPESEIARENISKNTADHGKKLGEYAVQAEGSYTKVASGEVKVSVSVKTYDCDKSQDHLYQDAVKFMEIWDKQGFDAAKAALKDFPMFNSIYHAKYTVIKHDLPKTKSMTLYAVRFGDVGFACAPIEMFDTNGDEIKSGSQCKMTFIATMANGNQGYVPSALGYQNGGYSTDISRYAPGTGEEIAADLVSMLNSIG